jgi:hypothetical protein
LISGEQALWLKRACSIRLSLRRSVTRMGDTILRATPAILGPSESSNIRKLGLAIGRRDRLYLSLVKPWHCVRDNLCRCCFDLLCLGLASVRLATPANAETLWQIGVLDESSSEFSHFRDPATGLPRLDYANPAQDPVFILRHRTCRY